VTLAPDVRRVAPHSVDDLVAVMRLAYANGDALTFLGGGTEQDLGYPLEHVDAAISTERLNGILEYAPDDMTVTVQAGLTLAALQSALATRGQRLALDAPLAERATLGGLIATNGYGPRRTRHGTLRDLILGASFVRADGVLVRGGGKVVKNVAGFDVPKLLVGSLGTLGCIATATFRLHPLPEAERYVAVRCGNASDLRALCVALIEAQLEPAAVVALNVAEGWDVRVLFEGFSAGVEQQAAACIECARALRLEAEVDEGVGATRFWSDHEKTRTGGDVRVKVTFLPESFPQIYDVAMAQHARAFGPGAVAVYPTVGVGFCSGTGGPGDVLAEILPAARTAVEAAGGTLVVLAAPAAVRERVDVYGTLPPSFPLMQRIKERFDPERRCNRGRFVGHL
jgi:glycolate oxidase FAD binding subunit